MPTGFHSIRFTAADSNDDATRSIGARSMSKRQAPILRHESRSFENDEAAARFYLGRVFETDQRSHVRGLSAADRPQVVPDMRLRRTQTVPSSKDRMLVFEQTQGSIPVFGSRTVVQLDADRHLVDVTGDVAEIGNVPTMPSLGPADALERVAKFAHVAPHLKGVAAPTLTFFHAKEWHLAYFFKKVPAVPSEERPKQGMGERGHHGLGRSPRELRPLFDYLVDAVDGEILFYYSAAPMLSVPSRCWGEGEVGGRTLFFGSITSSGFEMIDPQRSIKTYDLRRGDIDTASVPQDAVANSLSDWKTSNRAAVSAHVHATKVYDFYKSVLLRDGIDDKGMDLVSVVNCTYPRDENPPEWHNAVWYDNKMWYGQDNDTGTLRSFSRFLDVIGHELTHGVTEHTSNLVYKDQSGALNESFSDIFGVVIANWDPRNPTKPAKTWNWQIGAQLGGNGKPLRDMSDPSVTGDPAHMDDYLSTREDNGGVHTNSNIHNKAAYNVFTAMDGGAPSFPPMDAAELYYLTLTRLSRLATFADVLKELVAVAETFYAGEAVLRAKQIKKIREAYAAVGIA